MGEPRVGKPKVGADKLTKLSQVGLNREDAYQQSLARGEAWRSMPHIEGTPNNRKAIADMKRLGEMFPTSLNTPMTTLLNGLNGTKLVGRNGQTN